MDTDLDFEEAEMLDFVIDIQYQYTLLNYRFSVITG